MKKYPVLEIFIWMCRAYAVMIVLGVLYGVSRFVQTDPVGSVLLLWFGSFAAAGVGAFADWLNMSMKNQQANYATGELTHRMWKEGRQE